MCRDEIFWCGFKIEEEHQGDMVFIISESIASEAFDTPKE